MTAQTYPSANYRDNVVTLPSIPVPLDTSHEDTAPDNRVSMLRAGRRAKVKHTVTPEQMVAILRDMKGDAE